MTNAKQVKEMAESWLEELTLYGGAHRVLDETPGKLRVRLDTHGRWYTIHFTWPTATNPTDYISGYAHRSEEPAKDMSDGPLSQDTWNRITRDIAALETALPNDPAPGRRKRRRHQPNPLNLPIMGTPPDATTS